MKDRFAELPLSVVEPLFVYILLPGEIEPDDRVDQFEEPLEKCLAHSGVGEITGGGSMLSSPDEEGRRVMEYCGIDVDLIKPRDGIALLVTELGRLKAPHGTVLQFSLGEAQHEVNIYENPS